MVSTPYKYQLNPNRYIVHYISYASIWVLDCKKWEKIDSANDFSTTFCIRFAYWCNLWIQTCPSRYFISQNKKFTSPFSLHLFYNLKTAYTIGCLRNDGPLKQYFSLKPKKNFLIAFWSLHRNVSFTLTLYILFLTAFQLQLLNGILICQKSLTTHWLKCRCEYKKTLAWKRYSNNEVLFLIEQLAVFISNKQYRHHTYICKYIYIYIFSIYFLCSSYLFCKYYEHYFKTEQVYAQSAEFQKTLSIIKQSEDLI